VLADGRVLGEGVYVESVVLAPEAVEEEVAVYLSRQLLCRAVVVGL
jgi:hypothetical protein